MKKERIISILLLCLSSVLFIIAIVLVLNTNYFEFSNKTESKENNKSQLKEEHNTNLETSNNNLNTNQNNNTVNENTNKDLDSNNNLEPENPKIETVINQETNSNIIEDNKTELNTEDNTLSNQNESNVEDNSISSESEVTVISYFESQDNLITPSTNQDDRTLREKAKDTFVTVVDFIFYNKEIKGYTFKELTTSAKLKVIKIGLSIDHKIDEYFPDYKDVIKDKYDNIKGKLAVKYLEFTSTLCETVGENTCNQAKEDFNTMKKNFSITWQLIKELAKNGSSKIKNFYESWRDS